MFVNFDPRIRVHLGVVTLGSPPRLADCLSTLVAHESRHDFVVSCLVNRDAMRQTPLVVDVPDGVRVERSVANVGWSGGLHLLRALSDGELFVWVQDDMLPEPGWLDALVDAADAHPSVAVFGSLRVDDDGRVLPTNAGWAQPPDDVASWNETDTTAEDTPAEVARVDWVGSKGCLTRTSVFDEVSGPDLRLWPLNHVDKEYCTHVRCHGYAVALVPGARLRHVGSQSSPWLFRSFLNEWRDGWFDERWAGPVRTLARGGPGPVDHPCAEWRTEQVGLVEGLSGREASALLVPFTRAADSSLAEIRAHYDGEVRSREERLVALQAQRDEELRSAERQVAHREEQIAHLQQQLVEGEERLRRLRRRVHKLRRRLRQAQPAPSLVARASRRVRRILP